MMVKINNKCIVCDNITAHSRIFEFKKGGNIIMCDICKHKTVEILPDKKEISDVNTGMYKSFVIDFNIQKYNWAKESVRQYLKEIENIPTKGFNTILDIGGGVGYYSKAFEDAGFNVTMVDMDKESINFAKKKLKLENAFLMSSNEFFKQNPNKKFDIIFCRHIIEHLENPRTLINDIYNLLNIGGVLILETDNNFSYELLLNYGSRKFYKSLYKKSIENFSISKLLKNPIFAIDPPRHLHAFRIKNLNKVLKNYNFEIKKATTYTLGSKYWPNIPNVTFKQLLLSYKSLSGKYIKNKTYDFFLNWIRFILNKFGMGAGILIIASKK